ncbi:MAG: hypothetical protein ACE14M_13140 [Terriglobales bacterium]
MKRLLAILVLFLAVAAVPAFSQGCAMCYQSAKALGSQDQKALNRAVLVLLLPTVTFIAGAVGLTYHYRKPREH